MTGLRVKRDRGRSWGFVCWLPVVVDFGYLRFNRWWWHNLHCRFATVYRLHYGEWPTYYEWDKAARARASADGDSSRHQDSDVAGVRPVGGSDQ